MAATIDAKLQLAVYAALTADAGLTAMLPDGAGGITAFASPGLAAPYVVIAETGGSAMDTQGTRGRDSRIGIEIYSRAPGGAEARELLERVAAVLEQAALTVGGHVVVMQDVTSTRCVQDPDGQTYRGLLDLRVISEESA